MPQSLENQPNFCVFLSKQWGPPLAYNKAGQRITVYRADTSYDTVTHDNDGQAQSAVGSGGESTENLGYLYDPAWNLSHRTNASVVTAFGVNNLNELTSEPNGTPTYDGNGNLTSESNGRSFVYHDENQLTSVSYGTSYRSDFVYDGLGRRRKEIDYAYSGGWYPTGEMLIRRLRTLRKIMPIIPLLLAIGV